MSRRTREVAEPRAAFQAAAKSGRRQPAAYIPTWISWLTMIPQELNKTVSDKWRLVRVVFAFALATATSIFSNLAEFWPTSGSDSGPFDAGSLALFGDLVILIALIWWTVGGLISLFRRRWKSVCSNIIAWAVIVGCTMAVEDLQTFDPWYRYVKLNEDQLTKAAMDKEPLQGGAKYTDIETRDISHYFAGYGGHLVDLLYSDGDIAGDSDEGRTTHIYVLQA